LSKCMGFEESNWRGMVCWDVCVDEANLFQTLSENAE